MRIIAASGPVAQAPQRQRFEAGLEVLRALGLRPMVDDGIYHSVAYLAGSDRQRLGALKAALNDTEAAAVWLARGGYGAARLLPGLATWRAAVAKRPRWLVGFSDVTALHLQWQQAGLESLHAANVTGLAEWSDDARERLRRWLFEGRFAALSGGVALSGGLGQVRGRLAGGNLTVLASLAGTGFLPSFNNALILLEDVDEKPYALDRSLTQLLQAGAFAGVVGFIVGQLTNCRDAPHHRYGRSAVEAICAVLQPLGVPVVAGFAVGHERSSLPLPLGASALLDPAAGTLCIE